MLAHYGVTDFERTPELEEAVFRIFLAQQRAAADVSVIVTFLQQWLTEPLPGEKLRELIGQPLEHLIFATQLRFPVVGDLARSIVFRWAAQPLLRRKRAEVYANVRAHLRHLDQHPDAPDRGERIATMVASAEPLVRLLGQRIGRPGIDNGPMLEVLSRRYYGNRAVLAAHTAVLNGHSFFTAEYERDGARVRLLAAAADFAELHAVLAKVAELANPGSVADVYLTWADQPDTDEMAAALREIVDRAGLLDVLRRVTVSVAGRTGAAMHHHFTFRQGLGEDRVIRGLHPQIAQRLQLPQLRNFDLTRLPSADEEVYLFRCVAPDNPADERLAALAQVRDLTPLRDADGRILALPAIEGALDACLDAIRKVQAQRPAKKRFDTNRITLYVWPTERTEHRRPVHRHPAVAAAHRRRRPGGGAVPRPAARRGNRRAGRHRGAGLLRRGRAAVGGRADDRADPAAGRLPAEGALGAPARHHLPVRADRDAGRAERHLHRARPGRRRRAGPGTTGRRGRTRPASSPAW